MVSLTARDLLKRRFSAPYSPGFLGIQACAFLTLGVLEAPLSGVGQVPSMGFRLSDCS